MSFLDLLNHFANFVAPALFVAFVLALLARIALPKKPETPGLLTQITINFGVGAAVLAAALVYLGRDGKMAGYGALTVACATVQWLLCRGWKG